MLAQDTQGRRWTPDYLWRRPREPGSLMVSVTSTVAPLAASPSEETSTTMRPGPTSGGGAAPASLTVTGQPTRSTTATTTTAIPATKSCRTPHSRSRQPLPGHRRLRWRRFLLPGRRSQLRFLQSPRRVRPLHQRRARSSRNRPSPSTRSRWSAQGPAPPAPLKCEARPCAADPARQPPRAHAGHQQPRRPWLRHQSPPLLRAPPRHRLCRLHNPRHREPRPLLWFRPRRHLPSSEAAISLAKARTSQPRSALPSKAHVKAWRSLSSLRA